MKKILILSLLIFLIISVITLGPACKKQEAPAEIVEENTAEETSTVEDEQTPEEAEDETDGEDMSEVSSGQG